MAKVRYTPRANADMARIGAYIAKDNPTAALRWVDVIQGLCALLAIQPEIGQRVKTKEFGEVRRRVAGSYLIYYRPAANGVDILTIRHGAREHGRP